jgi:hypothetical protein
MTFKKLIRKTKAKLHRFKCEADIFLLKLRGYEELEEDYDLASEP